MYIVQPLYKNTHERKKKIKKMAMAMRPSKSMRPDAQHTRYDYVGVHLGGFCSIILSHFLSIFEPDDIHYLLPKMSVGVCCFPKKCTELFHWKNQRHDGYAMAYSDCLLFDFSVGQNETEIESERASIINRISTISIKEPYAPSIHIIRRSNIY